MIGLASLRWEMLREAATVTPIRPKGRQQERKAGGRVVFAVY